MKGKGSQKASNETGYLPALEYDDTLLSTANGSLGNTLVNYSTVSDDKIRLPVYPYYVDLRVGSQRQQFSLALNLYLPHTWVPCDCLHCGTARRGTPASKPFSTLSSSTLSFISCTDNRCLGGSADWLYGCNVDALPNYLNTTGALPGDDALCVYRAYGGWSDYYEADYGANSYLLSMGHVVEDTVYLTAPDGTEVNRTITLGCGIHQEGYWGMQGWQYGTWTGGGVLGLGYDSPFIKQLSGSTRTFAVCLDEPTPTNKTGWAEKMPLAKGSSHLTIGAVGLPAGASYASASFPAGLAYSHITLVSSTAAPSTNISDDFSSIPSDALAPPGFFFMPESFVHLLREPLFGSLISTLQKMTGHNLGIKGNYGSFQLPCFVTKDKHEDPFTTFPTMDIAFNDANTSSPTSHFFLKPSEYLAKVSANRYCVLATKTPAADIYANFIGEPGLFNKYLFIDYTNGIGGWIDAPQCGATPQMPPPSPPPATPVAKAASTTSLSLATAALAAVVATTSTALLALSL
ncbi:hypothetical protein CLOM_g7779 [Closterium sp. NIES-68]|nr:hypothetical protein CLOM_g7779 [Closterium sp. NIES-68]